LNPDVISNHSLLLEEYLPDIRRASRAGPILDLACGSGRNGLYLLSHDIPVVFADINPEALARIDTALHASPYRENRKTAQCWQADFEAEQPGPLAEKVFGGIMVYRYLHRPLMETIRHAVLPGGLVVYETFTVDQPEYGRPTNPDYLLRHDELAEHFDGWEILHQFEGVVTPRDGEKPQAIARILARKPVER